MIATQLMQGFDDVALQHVPRELNHEANEMAQVASRVYIPENLKEMVINIKRRTLTSLQERGVPTDIYCLEVEQNDWRYPLIRYLENPTAPSELKTRMRAVHYVIFDKELYKKG